MNKIIVERSTVDIFDRATGNCFRFLLCRVEIFRWKKEKKKRVGEISESRSTRHFYYTSATSSRIPDGRNGEKLRQPSMFFEIDTKNLYFRLIF